MKVRLNIEIISPKLLSKPISKWVFHTYDHRCGTSRTVGVRVIGVNIQISVDKNQNSTLWSGVHFSINW